MSLFIFLCYRVVPLLNVILHDVEYFFVKGRLFISKLEFQCFFPFFFVVVMDLLDLCWTFEKLSFSRKQHYEPTIQISWHLSKSMNTKLIDLIGSILPGQNPYFLLVWNPSYVLSVWNFRYRFQLQNYVSTQIFCMLVQKYCHKCLGKHQ